MRRFDFFQPKSTAEAIALLSRHSGRANLLAGGTDLLVEIKESIRAPHVVVDCKKIPGLGTLSVDAREGLRFGALVTARDIETCAAVREHFRGLWQAVRELGSIQVRNRATIAGNICRASPSADTLPPLIADDARLGIVGPNGERTVMLEEFFTGPGKTVLAADEIVTTVAVPAPPPGTGKCYIKHGRRKAMELATVGVAVTLTVAAKECREICIALGAVAPTPIRARQAEAVLRGQALSATAIDRAAEVAAGESRPISNIRGSADYRRKMVAELTRRAIHDALEAVR
jgi:aerobic carbon-monoxide dehydrogenase medium subunit